MRVFLGAKTVKEEQKSEERQLKRFVQMIRRRPRSSLARGEIGLADGISIGVGGKSAIQESAFLGELRFFDGRESGATEQELQLFQKYRANVAGERLKMAFVPMPAMIGEVGEAGAVSQAARPTHQMQQASSFVITTADDVIAGAPTVRVGTASGVIQQSDGLPSCWTSHR